MDEEATPPRPRTPVTAILVAANLAVFFAIWRSGANPLLIDSERLVEFGAVDMRAVWEGEVWRLASGMFIHVALWHLALNMWVLWQVGRLLEQVMGSSRFLLVYLISGIGGFALSLLFHPALTAGASGAVFGVIGGLLALAAASRDPRLSRFLYSAMVPVVAATLAIGTLLPFVDNSAHVGGLLFGYLLSYGLLSDGLDARLPALHRSDPAQRPSRWGNVALAASLLAFAVLLPLSLRPAFSPRYQALRGQTALAHGKIDAARTHLEAAERLAPNDSAVLALRARFQVEQGDGARGYYEEALSAQAIGLEEAFYRVLMEAGGRGEEDVLFRDPVFTAGLCDAALAVLADEASPNLLNNCAWLMARSAVPRAQDVPRAVELATRAVQRVLGPDRERVSAEEKAAYMHTQAYALAEAGDPQEALAIMERVRAEGFSRASLYEGERRRFERAVADAEAERPGELGEPEEPEEPEDEGGDEPGQEPEQEPGQKNDATGTSHPGANNASLD